MTPEERFDRIEQQLEKNTSAIRDLIVVSRTVLDSVVELRQIQREDQQRNDRNLTAVIQAIGELEQRNRELQDLQRHTDEKLNTLIDSIDRMIRNRGNGQQT